MIMPRLKELRRQIKSLSCLLKYILFSLSYRALLSRSKSWSQMILQLQAHNQESAKNGGRKELYTV
jgi:hypothetical protein